MLFFLGKEIKVVKFLTMFKSIEFHNKNERKQKKFCLSVYTEWRKLMK